MEASMIRNGFAVATFLFASVAFAQNEPGTITGTVTDPDKGIVVGVQVQAKHVATAMVYKTDSSRTGAFTFSQLPPGMYELSVPVTGFTFAPYIKKDLRLDAGQTLTADIRLEWPINLGTVGDDTFLTLRNRYAGLSGPAPRSSDGKPDVSGVWNGSPDPNPEPPGLLPWAATIQKQRFANNLKDLPSAYCLPGRTLSPARSRPPEYRYLHRRSRYIHEALAASHGVDAGSGRRDRGSDLRKQQVHREYASQVSESVLKPLTTVDSAVETTANNC